MTTPWGDPGADPITDIRETLDRSYERGLGRPDLKRVLILTDEELDNILTWQIIAVAERGEVVEDEGLAEKIRVARLAP